MQSETSLRQGYGVHTSRKIPLNPPYQGGL